MSKDSTQTKKRLLKAATSEFAEFGIAGARIDRIAEKAKTNKQMIYAYFGNKDALFDTVFSAHVNESLARVDFDVADLPVYAGNLFDHFENDPDALRLATWYRLERPRGAGLEAVVAITKTRLDRLRHAQSTGALPAYFDPVQLLAVIQAIATSWATMNPEYGSEAAQLGREQRRSTVVEAVRRVLV